MTADLPALLEKGDGEGLLGGRVVPPDQPPQGGGSWRSRPILTPKEDVDIERLALFVAHRSASSWPPARFGTEESAALIGLSQRPQARVLHSPQRAAPEMTKPPVTDVDRQVEEIRRMRREWVHVVNAGDIDRYTNLLTRDAVWIPPGQPAVEGRKAIREWLEPFFREYRYDFALKGSRVQVAGDWAVERGVFDSSLQLRRGGAAQRQTGTYIVLWRQIESGEWKIERYIDGSAER